MDLLRYLGKGRNDRVFGPKGLETYQLLTKKASRQAREVCGKQLMASGTQESVMVQWLLLRLYCIYGREKEHMSERIKN